MTKGKFKKPNRKAYYLSFDSRHKGLFPWLEENWQISIVEMQKIAVMDLHIVPHILLENLCPQPKQMSRELLLVGVDFENLI